MPANPWIASLADAFINNALSALGAGVRAMENPGEFLRDDLPNGTDGLTRWIQDRNRRACRRHARNEAAGLYSNLGALRRPRYAHCGPYLDSINEGPSGSGSYGPPFTGGQCSGTIYEVIATFNLGTDVPGGCSAPFDQAINGAMGVVGPIEGLTLGSAPADGAQFPRKTAKLNHGNNQQIDLGQTFGGCNLPFVVIKSVTPMHEGPNNCGNPPNEYNPPSWPPNLPSLPPPEIAPPGGDGDDDIEVDPDGNWRICENGDCTPSFTPGGGGAPGDPGGEEDGDPQETNPNDPNNPNEVSGCVEDGNVLVGLKIEFIQIDPNSSGSNGIHYRVGWIFMGPGEDKLDLVHDGKTMEDGQFIIPDSSDCTCYKVRANMGWRLRVQAYSKPIPEEN